MSTATNKFKVFHSYNPVTPPKTGETIQPAKTTLPVPNLQMKTTSNVNTRPILIAKPTSVPSTPIPTPQIPINPPKVTKIDSDSTTGNINRGNLPKASVDILRKWLFAHFDHPYPNDSDKEKLMKETNLSLTQVNNWFINARRRIWKPFKENKTEKPSVKQEVTSTVPKVPISQIKHEEERPTKRKKVEEYKSDEEIDSFDDIEIEDENQRVERVQRENHILKEELRRLSSSYYQLLTDFSQRNEDLIKQLSNLEILYRHLELANIEMSKKLSEPFKDKDLVRPVSIRPPFRQTSTIFKEFKPSLNTLPIFDDENIQENKDIDVKPVVDIVESVNIEKVVNQESKEIKEILQ